LQKTEALQAIEYTVEDIKSNLQDLVNAHGDLAYAFARSFLNATLPRIPIKEKLNLLDELMANTPYGNEVQDLKAIYLVNLQEVERPLELCSSPNQYSMIGESLALGIYRDQNRAVDLASSLDLVSSNYGLDTPGVEQRASYQVLRQTESFKDLWEETEVERPLACLHSRLDNLPLNETDQGLALVDSVNANTNSLSMVPQYKFKWNEAAGRTTPLVDIMDKEKRQLSVRELNQAAYIARAQGDMERYTAIVELALEDSWGSYFIYRSAIYHAWQTKDNVLADKALVRLREEIPRGHPIFQYYNIINEQVFQGEEVFKAQLQELDLGDLTDPALLGMFAGLAQDVQLYDMAEKWVQKGLSSYPQDGSLRYQQAQIHISRHENAPAAAILKKLTKEFPGSQQFVSDLLIVQDSVLTKEDFPAQQESPHDKFARFGDPIGDADYLLKMKLPQAEIDTFSSDAVTLLHRYSIVLDDVDKYQTRVRHTFQIRTKNGVNQYNKQVISFSPNNGIPVLRAARMLTPEGEIIDIPDSEILIRAPVDEDSDVSDSREMVIPFGGLEPGCIIDIVVDRNGWTNLINGMSLSYDFHYGIPTKTSIFEYWHSPDQAVTVIKSENMPPSEVIEESGVERHTLQDLLPVDSVDFIRDYRKTYPYVALSTFQSWGNVANSYGQKFWLTAKPTEKITALADKICADAEADSEKEKVEAVYRYLKDNISGLAVELGSGRYVPSTPEEVLQRRWGDCKDMSCLMISLLESVGVQARPVLVATTGSLPPRQDFPDLYSFNHMIVQANGISSDYYCDPINGLACAEDLPVTSEGNLGLHLHRDGEFDLTPVQGRNWGKTGFEIMVDVYPQENGHLRFEVIGSFNGRTAEFPRQYLAYQDSNLTKGIIGAVLGYGMHDEVHMENWDYPGQACADLELKASFLDTIWSSPSANEGMLMYYAETSDWWGWPDTENRKYMVDLPSIFDNRLTLRLHEVGDWVPTEDIPEYKVDNDLFKAQVKKEKKEKDGQEWIEVSQRFALTENHIPVDRMQEVTDGIFRFKFHSRRLFRFRRALDEDKKNKISKFVMANPNDLGFLTRSAYNILGSDMGGSGQEGRDRRKFVGELVEPMGDSLTDHPQLGGLLVASYVKDNQWLAADSLCSQILEKNPAENYIINISASIKQELGDLEASAQLLEQLNQVSGSAEDSFRLMVVYVALEDDEKLTSQLDRLELMGVKLKPRDLLLIRLQGCYMASDFDRAQETLNTMEGYFEPEVVAEMKAEHLVQSHQYDKAIEPYLASWKKQPTNPGYCNNLAWCLAMTGVDLGKAEELARAASNLSLDATASKHTLATVLSRRKEWKEAAAIFEETFTSDDRPDSRLVNGLFLGLCRHSQGREDEAREIWSDLEGLIVEEYWTGALDRCQELDKDGKNPWISVFPDLGEDNE